MWRDSDFGVSFFVGGSFRFFEKMKLYWKLMSTVTKDFLHKNAEVEKMRKVTPLFFAVLLLTGCSFEVRDVDPDQGKFKIEIENNEDTMDKNDEE